MTLCPALHCNCPLCMCITKEVLFFSPTYPSHISAHLLHCLWVGIYKIMEDCWKQYPEDKPTLTGTSDPSAGGREGESVPSPLPVMSAEEKSASAPIVGVEQLLSGPMDGKNMSESTTPVASVEGSSGYPTSLSMLQPVTHFRQAHAEGYDGYPN